jgi:hypothetical protein
VRRRQLLASLTATATAAASTRLLAAASAPGPWPSRGSQLVERVRDTMLGLGTAPALIPAGQLQPAVTHRVRDVVDALYSASVVWALNASHSRLKGWASS